METAATNELEVSETNNHLPKLYIMFLKFLVYFTMYIIVPLYVFLTETSILADFINPIISLSAIRVLVVILITYITYRAYKWVIHAIFAKLRFNLKNEWMHYITIKEWKISYYKSVTSWVTSFNGIDRVIYNFVDSTSNVAYSVYHIMTFGIIILLCFLSCAWMWSNYEATTYGYYIWNSEILLNYIKNINVDAVRLILFFLWTSLFTICLLFFMAIIFLLIDTFLLQCVFPVTNGIIDTSDYPISFIRKATEELDFFEFTDNFAQKQQKKNQITQLISYALIYFIKVDNGNPDTDWSNFCYPLWAGHLSEAARRDVLFRTNGLYKKIDELCAEINNMNSQEEQSRIVKDLNIYLKVIEDRDLSKIEPVEYQIKKSDLTSTIIKVISILNKIF